MCKIGKNMEYIVNMITGISFDLAALVEQVLIQPWTRSPADGHYVPRNA